MIKKILFVLSLFLFVSCDNLLERDYGNNQLAFGLGDAANSINLALKANKDVTDESKLNVDFELLRGDYVCNKQSKVVSLIDLPKTTVSFDNIPNGNNYFISIKIFYNDILIYEALSNKIVLNERKGDVVVDLQLKQNNSKIAFELNGGKIKDGQIVPVDYFINSKLINFPVPVKENYQFDGWYLSNNFLPDEKIIELGSNCFLGNITLYAKWIDMEKVASINVLPSDENIDCGDNITLQATTEGAVIHYTTDNTEPSSESPIYDSVNGLKIKEEFINNDSFTVKAVAMKDGMLNSDIVTKVFKRKRYTVTFDNNGIGTKPDNLTGIKKNDFLTAEQLKGVKCDNYEFLGWYDGDRKVEAGKYKVTDNVTFTAKWTAISVSIETAAGAIDFGDSIKIVCNPAEYEIHYTIDGSEPDASSPLYKEPLKVDDAFISNGDSFTIKAVALKNDVSSAVAFSEYTLKRYTITFNNNNHGDVQKAVSGKKGDVIKLPVLNEIDYDFGGWQLNGSLVDNNYTIESDVTLTAIWNGLGVLSGVTFMPSRQAGIDNSLDYEDSVELICDPGASIYYTIDGNDPVVSGIEYKQPVVITGDVTINAVAKKTGMSDSEVTTVSYKLKKYNVIYNENGQGGSVASIQLHKNQVITVDMLKTLSEPGYDFGEWYMDSSLNRKVVAGTDKMGTADINLYAKWTPITYNITYNLDGGTAPLPDNPGTYNINDNNIVLNAPTKNGYTFDGWYKDTSKITEIPKGSYGDVNLTAKWNINTYTITYNLDGGTAPSPDNPGTYNINDNNITLKSPTKKGYTFDGWYKDNGKITEITKGSYGNVNLTAKWNVITYNITYENCNVGADGIAIDNSMNTDITYTIESPVITLKNPVKSGFSFDGWFSSNDVSGTKVTEIATGSTEDKVLYARWTDVAPAAVTNITPSVVNGKVHLEWGIPADADFEKVIITCQNTSINKEIIGQTATVDLEIPAGDINKGDYKFIITAYDKGGNSTPAEKLVQLPKVTSTVIIPDWAINNNKNTYELELSGTNMNVAGIDYNCAMSSVPSAQGNTPSAGSITGTSVIINVPISKDAGTYTVSVTWAGGKIESSFDVRDYIIGDVVYSDGSISNKTALTTTATPVAVIFKAADKSSPSFPIPALGVGLQESNNQLLWANSGSTGFKNNIAGVVCTPSVKDGAGAADNSTFTDDKDGFNNFDTIVAEYTGASVPGTEQDALNDCPAFKYAKEYTTVNYTAGWYMPSLAEICDLYKNKTDVNKALTAIKSPLRVASGEWYWSSSQDSAGANNAWKIMFYDGHLLSSTKASGGYVRCIHKF